jgi:hypothetical protein
MSRLSNSAILKMLDEIHSEIVQREIESASSPKAKARPARPNVTPPGEESITEWFCRLSGLPVPALGTEKQRRSAAALWFNPLREIFAAAGSQERGCEAMSRAIRQMRHDRLTIASPGSVLKVALSELGKMNTTTRSSPAPDAPLEHGRF